MAVVGPGAQAQDHIAPSPTLQGVSEYQYVTILNPLPDDFAIKVAQDVPRDLPFNVGKDMSGKVNQVTNTEQDVRQIYGLNLKNPDFIAREHISNSIIIKAGQTINLKGDQAQVAVRQLVNEIAQREGSARLLADPTVRRSIEDKIIKGVGSIQELMDTRLQSPRSQMDEAIKQSNEVSDEEAFPDLQADQGRAAEASDTANDSQSQPRKVGRPKKADS